MLTLKVLGSGCPNCKQVEAHAREALAQLCPEDEVEVIKVTDPMEISAHVLRTPGLMINDRVVSQGRIPQVHEIMSWLAEALEVN
jgi:small redox-active disulfide protein 2